MTENDTNENPENGTAPVEDSESTPETGVDAGQTDAATAVDGDPAGEEAGSSGDVQNAIFAGLMPNPDGDDKSNLSLLLDVTVPISVELGRSHMKIEEILRLTPGSVIELDKHADEAVDLMVNGKLMARGEIVVVDNNFGLRIREIVEQELAES